MFCLEGTIRNIESFRNRNYVFTIFKPIIIILYNNYNQIEKSNCTVPLSCLLQFLKLNVWFVIAKHHRIVLAAPQRNISRTLITL
jgi:uncharacterized membrane protein YesL